MDKYDVDELHDSVDRIKRAFKELEESVLDYYHKFGEHNGMDFTYELVKYSDAINEYKRLYEGIFNRVEKRILYKNSEAEKTETLEPQTIKRRQFK